MKNWIYRKKQFQAHKRITTARNAIAAAKEKIRKNKHLKINLLKFKTQMNCINHISFSSLME